MSHPDDTQSLLKLSNYVVEESLRLHRQAEEQEQRLQSLMRVADEAIALARKCRAVYGYREGESITTE